MTNVSTGRQAEVAAAEYLREKGFTVVEQNWRTRYCEIDIVGRLGNTVYFIEVKYRKSAAQGTGLDYITPKKLNQMRFAAEMWVQEKSWTGEYRLGAIEVSGPAFEITDFVSDWM
jgi:Holliday junction resolvase-like predicted endonuclease